jgi:hypothetical protein
MGYRGPRDADPRWGESGYRPTALVVAEKQDYSKIVPPAGDRRRGLGETGAGHPAMALKPNMSRAEIDAWNAAHMKPPEGHASLRDRLKGAARFTGAVDWSKVLMAVKDTLMPNQATHKARPAIGLGAARLTLASHILLARKVLSYLCRGNPVPS